jgi:hypothetical protein
LSVTAALEGPIRLGTGELNYHPKDNQWPQINVNQVVSDRKPTALGYQGVVGNEQQKKQLRGHLQIEMPPSHWQVAMDDFSDRSKPEVCGQGDSNYST